LHRFLTWLFVSIPLAVLAFLKSLPLRLSALVTAVWRALLRRALNLRALLARWAAWLLAGLTRLPKSLWAIAGQVVRSLRHLAVRMGEVLLALLTLPLFRRLLSLTGDGLAWVLAVFLLPGYVAWRLYRLARR
jgi:hypothetical protein